MDLERGVPFSVRGGTGFQLEDEDSGMDLGFPWRLGLYRYRG